MAKPIGRELPEGLFNRLRGTDLEAYAAKVILISTVDANGWPHPAMLSYFEVIATDRHNIRLAPYKDSGTTNNMRSNGKATISIIDKGTVYYIKANARELKREMICFPHLSKLNLEVEQVLSDQTDEQIEAGAVVTSGVTYQGLDLTAERLKANEVIKELLE